MRRKLFDEVADVEGFPSESEFAESCTDASKGMTREELTHICASLCMKSALLTMFGWQCALASLPAGVFDLFARRISRLPSTSD